MASESDLAISNYDSLSADDVQEKLSELSQVDLAKVGAYERRTQNRSTITSRIEALQESEPWPGYDELGVEEVRAVLSEGATPASRRPAATSGSTRTAPACSRPPSASSATHKHRWSQGGGRPCPPPRFFDPRRRRTGSDARASPRDSRGGARVPQRPEGSEVAAAAEVPGVAPGRVLRPPRRRHRIGSSPAREAAGLAREGGLARSSCPCRSHRAKRESTGRCTTGRGTKADRSAPGADRVLPKATRRAPRRAVWRHRWPCRCSRSDGDLVAWPTGSLTATARR